MRPLRPLPCPWMCSLHSWHPWTPCNWPVPRSFCCHRCRVHCLGSICSLQPSSPPPFNNNGQLRPKRFPFFSPRPFHSPPLPRPLPATGKPYHRPTLLFNKNLALHPTRCPLPRPRPLGVLMTQLFLKTVLVWNLDAFIVIWNLPYVLRSYILYVIVWLLKKPSFLGKSDMVDEENKHWLIDWTPHVLVLIFGDLVSP